MDIIKSATFDVRLKAGSYLVEEKSISYDRAMMLCNKAITENENNEIFCDQMAAVIDSFGFRGFGGKDIDIHVSAYLPTVQTGEIQTCPRRSEGPMANEINADTWVMRGGDKCCSYCGSIHPDRVIELIKELGPSIFDRTTKSYKGYINRSNVPNAGFGGIKFYIQHFDQIQIDKLNSLISGSTSTE